MGDADNTQVLASVQEMETWVDEALEDMDDGLDSLFSAINVINERTAYVMSEVSLLEKVRQCFAALNILVIPVVLAVGIAYGTSNVIEEDSGTQVAIELFIMFLMCVSACIGMPFYLFTLWSIFSRDDTKTDTSFLTRFPSSYSLITQGRSSMFIDDNRLTSSSEGSSLTRFQGPGRVVDEGYLRYSGTNLRRSELRANRPSSRRSRRLQVSETRNEAEEEAGVENKQPISETFNAHFNVKTTHPELPNKEDCDSRSVQKITKRNVSRDRFLETEEKDDNYVGREIRHAAANTPQVEPVVEDLIDMRNTGEGHSFVFYHGNATQKPSWEVYGFGL